MKKTLFFEIVRSYITIYLPSQKCCSPETIKSYKEVLNCFVDYLRDEKNLRFSEISFDIFTVSFIMEFLDWLQSTRKLKSSTRNQRLMVLRSFFRYAGMIDCSLVDIHMKMQDIPIQNGESKIVEYLSENALKTLLNVPNLQKSTEQRNAVFMTLMYDSAARCSELVNLQIKDLNLDTLYPTIYLHGKGNKCRLLPLMEKTALICKEYLDKFHPYEQRKAEDVVFFTGSNSKIRKISPDTVAYFMKKYGELAQHTCSDMPSRVHPHQLRHTRAIHLYRDGMPLSILAEFLGHANLETTKIYAYADTEMKRAAIKKAELNRNILPDTKLKYLNDDETLRNLSGLK